MHQYNIPQFIDSEDTIIGSITIRQFSYVTIGVVIGGFLWYFKPNIPVFVITIIPVAFFSLALAFFRINGQSFGMFIINIIRYILRPSLLLWSREIDPNRSVIKSTIQKRSPREKAHDKEFQQSRVEELAWTLDTYGEKIKPDTTTSL